MSHFKGGTMFEDSHNLQMMNEKVQSLANGVYKEFEYVIAKFGGEAVKGLMPIVVNILESLDHNIKDKQKNEVDLELTRVEVEHLRNQCDKEKLLRKSADTKYLEMEDLVEESKKQLSQLRNNSEMNARRLEMKIKNLQDHVSRMEEKESKLKEDYSKLHNKYSGLLKSHADFVQKTSESQSTTHNVSFRSREEVDREPKKCLNCSCDVVPKGISSLEFEPQGVANQQPSHLVKIFIRDRSVTPETSLLAEIAEAEGTQTLAKSMDEPNETRDSQIVQEDQDVERHIEEEKKETTSSSPQATIPTMPQIDISRDEFGTILDSFDTVSQESSVPDNAAVDEMFGECMIASNSFARKTSLKSKSSSGSSSNRLFEIEHDTEEEEEEIDQSKAEVKNVSLFEEFSILDEDVGTDFAGVGAEVDKLIQENSELLATKNALNILKDDLIADVEELSGELELTRQELLSAREERKALDFRIVGLEEELRRCREELAKLRLKLEAREQEADKTTFSRAELVRVLMERNQYKEKWMELQEAVRWAETVRASRAHPELAAAAAPEAKKSRTSVMWGLFNSFVGREKEEN